jgi:hypothetical protein
VKAALEGARDIVAEGIHGKCRSPRPPARLHEGTTPSCVARSSTASRRPARSSPTISTIPSAGPRCRATGRSPCCAAGTRTLLTVDHRRRCRTHLRRSSRWSASSPPPMPIGIRPAGRQVADAGDRLDLAGETLHVAVARPDARPARACRGRGDPRVLPAISRTCCSPPLPARAPPWASIRASAPASRSPSSTAPARCSTPRRSTPSRRRTTCAARRLNWPGCSSASTRSS